ncbi:MAG: NAD(P)H-quinone oxidoreductase subunit 4 [Gloeomargaritaceae cyanobacterium C42_A2020_066]|nr:NAD(P)H-quinone oxidoreductase subunit 4 [Gloeomargaritaceae cyanobacterium C42_A2020_066]
MEPSFPWLTVLTLLPLAAAAVIPLLPDKEGRTVRGYALGVGFVDLALMVWAFWSHFDATQPTYQLVEQYAWMPQVGLTWSVAADGLSVSLILLSGLVTTLAMLAAWRVNHRPKLFYALMLVLYSAQVGVFAAQDLLLLFLMWELELVPVYLLIAIWGGPKRQYAATKFILYTALGSIFILVGALALAFRADTFTFNMAALAAQDYSLAFELVVYLAFLVAFGMKLAVFPLHTWLPDAHGEASAPVSMILAGVLLKMGGYGLIRLNVELLPQAHLLLAPALGVLGVVNIIYGALTAYSQTNLKRRLAYSSISHMGFVLVGIAALDVLGLDGAILQMLSHGLISAALFFLAGVTYDRTHTLAMNEMGGIGRIMPKVFALFTAGAMASLALPGMSGFASEISIFLGVTSSEVYGPTFRTVMVVLAAVGLVLTPIYLLSMLGQVFFGTGAAPACDLDQEHQHREANQGAICFGTSCVVPSEAEFGDATPREVFVAACFLALIIGIGVYPRLATQVYDATATAVIAQVQDSSVTLARLPQLPAGRPVGLPTGSGLLGIVD